MSGGGQTHRIEVSIEACPSRRRMSRGLSDPGVCVTVHRAATRQCFNHRMFFPEADTCHFHVLRDLNVPVIPRPQGPSDELAFCAGPRKAEDRLENLLEKSA